MLDVGLNTHLLNYFNSIFNQSSASHRRHYMLAYVLYIPIQNDVVYMLSNPFYVEESTDGV